MVAINDLKDESLNEIVGDRGATQLRNDIDLIEGVYDEFDRNRYLAGKFAQVFFGSALIKLSGVPCAYNFPLSMMTISVQKSCASDK